MCKMNKKDKKQLLDIFGQPNIQIEYCDYKEYLKEPTKYYKVFDSGLVPVVDISVTPAMRGIARYEITFNNKKFSRLARPNAVLHTPMAADILEIYNLMKLRYLAQISKREIKR